MPNTLARQLYPPTRTESMSVAQLSTIFAFAYADTQNPDVEYAGMSRDETEATAWRTCSDIAFVLADRSARGNDTASTAVGRLAELMRDE